MIFSYGFADPRVSTFGIPEEGFTPDQEMENDVHSLSLSLSRAHAHRHTHVGAGWGVQTNYKVKGHSPQRPHSAASLGVPKPTLRLARSPEGS